MLASLSAGVVLLSVLARYLGRRKTPRPIRRPRIVSGRRTRNSMRSPNGNVQSFYFISFSFVHSCNTFVCLFDIRIYKKIINCYVNLNTKSIEFCVDITSLAGSKVSARSISPGGSVVALSDRMSLASGSLPGAAQDNLLSPQQLGVMGNFLK